MTSKTALAIGVVSLALSGALAGCMSASKEAETLTPVTVQLRWTHQAQFAGFYAADQNGYYADEGLAVSFIQGGPTVDLSASVVEGQAQFGVAGADALIVARSEGQPVKAIATVFRRSPLVFVTLQESGITSPEDFVGKTIQVAAPSKTVFQAVMAHLGISSDQYTEVNLSSSDLTPFYSGEVDVWPAYANNLVPAIEEAGYAVNVIYPDDYGVHFYADTVFTTDDLIADNPDLVLRFLRATLKGWNEVVEHPDTVGQLVLAYNPEADSAHEVDFMLASLPLINTGEDQIGWMAPDRWAGMQQTLSDQQVLEEPVDVEQVYTLDFLEAIYGK